MLSEALVTVENLTHVYAQGTPLEITSVEDISMAVYRAEFLALVGATGSGKSTLVQHFNGLLLPTCGRVLVEGADTRDKRVRSTLWQKVGLVFQYPEQQLFEETVYDDVAYGPKNMDLNTSQVDARVSEALELVGLDYKEIGHLSPFALSGGQKRRVALAGILAIKPRVLILDEPTAGLDPAGQRRLLDRIKSLQQSQGIAVVLITHSMEDAARLADRVIVLNHGKIFREGTPREIFSEPKGLREIGLELPFPTELTHKMRQAGKNIEKPALTLDEAESEIREILKQDR